MYIGYLYLVFVKFLVKYTLSISLWCVIPSCLCNAVFKLLCMVVTLLLVAKRKNPLANAGAVRDAGSIPGQDDPLEEGITTHSSILAWRIPWTEKLGGLQFVGSP